jgi:DNA-binding Lrp family transcriptional regulator
MLSSTALRIVRALAKGSIFTYEELAAKVGCPVNTLYVFCERLEKAKLIRRVKSLRGEPRRVRTYIEGAGAVEELKLKVIK